MRSLLRDYALILAVAATVLFTNLGGPRLWDRDEPRNAGCAAEMLERGDWITPVFNAELRTHKPVLLYWLIMTAYSVFGVNEFAARFWSAALACGTALATYHLGRRLFNASVGRWSAIILATTLMFDVAGRAATPDSPLIFFTTLAITAYVLATFQSRRPADHEDNAITPPLYRSACRPFPSSWRAVLPMYAAMGMAILAKGPVGMILPTAVIGMFLLIQRLPDAQDHGAAVSWSRRIARALRVFEPRHFLRTCWSMRPVTALVVALAVTLPWYVWVGMRTDGAFLRGFFLEHNVGRAMQPMEGHGGSLLFYPVAMLAGFFPWSVFMGPMLIGMVMRLRRGDAWQSGYVLAACWVSVYISLFSLAQTKLPSYITPCYPGMALLMGCFLHHWTRGNALAPAIWPKLSLACLGLVGLGLCIGLSIAAHEFFPGEQWLGLVGLVPLAAAAGCYLLIRRQQWMRAGQVFAISATAFATLAFAFVTARVDRHQYSDQLLTAIARRTTQPVLGSAGCLEPSWVFYARRPIRELALPPKPENGARPSSSVALSPNDVRAFLQLSPDHHVITTRAHLEAMADQLPAQIEVVSQAPYFLKREQLVVLGWKPSDMATARVGSKTQRR